MKPILSRKPQESGIALGGIGTGSVELYPDGEFHQWQIHNPERWAGPSWDRDVDDGEGHTGDLSFWIRTKDASGKVIVRKLGQRTSPKDFTHRMFGWNKPVAEIAFTGRFPVCALEYWDPALPLNLRLDAAAPFAPHDYCGSAMPGFYLDFTLENPGDAPLEADLLGILDFTGLTGRTCRREVQASAVSILTKGEGGDMTLTCCGDGEASWVTGDYGRYLREYVGNSQYGVTQESILFDFRREGRLPNTDRGTAPDLTAEDPARAAGSLPSGQSLLRRVRHLDPGYPADDAQREELRSAYDQMVKKMADSSDFGASALCRSLTLAPGERRTVRYLLTWFFPNHRTPDGTLLGHYYENLVSSSLEAARYLLEHDVAARAHAFADTLFTTSLPDTYPDSWSIHLSTLVKSSWWLKDGKFGLWEGLGYCGFHTTDISYHAAFGLTALFPRLQQEQMAMTVRFQREDGRVPHCFTPDLDHPDDGYDRVDMNPQFVLMVARDFLATGDRAYLGRMWEPVIRATEATAALDGDGDGLPDLDTRRNTYDSWNFSGAPSYISILYLAALRAASLLAERMDRPDLAARWDARREQGLASLEAKLWNGEYYDLWRDGDTVDGSLMTDQLDGEWFLRMMGLPGNLSAGRISKVLDRILETNFDPEAGLLNATCPEGHPTTLATYQNCQAGACWSGIAFAVAALCLSVGKRDWSDRLTRTVERIHEDFGYIWNHWECGFRYTRPLSSYTTLLAVLGLAQDREKGALTLNPQAETLPLFLWGASAVVKTGSSLRITVRSGSLTLGSLTLPERFGTVLMLNGREVHAEKTIQDGTVTWILPETEIHSLEAR